MEVQRRGYRGTCYACMEAKEWIATIIWTQKEEQEICLHPETVHSVAKKDISILGRILQSLMMPFFFSASCSL